MAIGRVGPGADRHDFGEARPRVMVVDEGAANRNLIAAYLAEVNCEVALAEDGFQAVSKAETTSLDMVLLDVQMPGLDGYEACRRIKSMPGGRLLPVVMITALDQVRDRVDALEAGADDFMSSP